MINKFHDHCCLCEGCRDLYEHQRNYLEWYITPLDSIYSIHENAIEYITKMIDDTHEHCCLCVGCEFPISEYHNHSQLTTRWEIKICRFDESDQIEEDDDHYILRIGYEVLDNWI